MSENKRDGLHGAGDRLRSVGSDPRLSGVSKVLQGFKDFIARGNAIELAVGVVIGAAFSSVVEALQTGFISPLIGWLFGKPNLTNALNIGPFSWRESTEADPIDPIRVGAILDALIQFLITAAAIYLLIVVPLNALANRRKRGVEDEPEAPAEDLLLLQEIRDLLAQRLSPAIVNDVTSTPPAPPATPSDGTDPEAPGSLPPTIPPGS